MTLAQGDLIFFPAMRFLVSLPIHPFLAETLAFVEKNGQSPGNA
jgi:hypothetical protein